MDSSPGMYNFSLDISLATHDLKTLYDLAIGYVIPKRSANPNSIFSS